MPAGRPTKYDPSYCEKAIEFMSQGYSKEALAGELKVSKDTLYEWIKVYPEFSDSIKEAEVQCQKFWEDLGIQLVLQGQGNATAWIYNMKNRFRNNGWSDKTETDITSGGEKLTNAIVFSNFKNETEGK